MLRSLAKLVRPRGFALRELVDHLQALEPFDGPAAADQCDAESLEGVVRRMKTMPELQGLTQSRDSLEESGLALSTEADHTLKIPLTQEKSTDTEFLCFTRLENEKWACYKDRTAG